jgi:HEAT repeat protein
MPAQLIFTTFYLISSVTLFNINSTNAQDLKTSKTQEYIENLKSKNNKVRENAASSLIRIGGLVIPSLEGVDDNAKAYILSRILKESSLCKKICNTRIGEISHKEKVLSLITSDLNSDKKDLRLISLVLLAAYSAHEKDFISAFIPVFRNELDDDVRDIAEKLAAEVGDSAIPQLMIAMKDEDERIHKSAVQSFVNMGERAADSLLKVFDDKNERIRIGAVDALGQITQINIHQNLKFYQKNSSEYQKIKQESYKLISAFNRALEDESPEVRFRAANALQIFEADAKPAIPNLIKALSLSAGNYANNFQIVETISKIGMEAIPEITAELESESSNKYVRAGLVEALGKIGGDKKVEYVPLITKLLMDKESGVRANAAEALGDIGYKSRGSINELFSLLKDNELSVRRQSIESIGKIAYSLSDDTKTLSDNDLIDIINELDKVLSFLDQKNINLNNLQSFDRITSESVKHIHRSRNNLKNEKDSRVYTKILSNPLIISIIGIIGFYSVLSVILYLLLRFRPLFILKINNVLSRVPSDLSLPPQLDTAFKIFSSGLRLFFVIGLWHYHPRVLDSWVAARIITARKNFSIKETVSARSIHVNAVPIRVKIKDQDKLISDLNNEDLSFLFSHRNCLLIYGEGGSGKTSLACQLAKWSMSDTKSEHLCENLMLPILLEQDLDLKVPEGKSLFLEEIRGQLKALTGESEPIPEEFCKQLLLNRRILVIVDRFSEMSESTRKAIRPVQPDFPANALIVTSRRKEELDQVHKDTIEPLRIDKDRLSPFMGDYLNSKQKRDLFNDHEFLEACSHMKTVVGQRNVTILLGKLYAEHMIARKEGFTKEHPENIPDLMLWYLNELNRGVGGNAPDNYVVHKHAKIIAWECLKNNLRPGSANREEVLLKLGETESESSLKYLQDKLRIIQLIRPSEIQVKFTLDPLAEYLAGLHIVDIFKDSEEEWNKFFETVDRFPLDEIQGFLLATNECVQVRMGENIIPQSAIENLHNISCSISIR